MKIEKVNENQLKFILSQNDLAERDIKISELAYGSEKLHDLFQEMMDEAITQFGFDFENKPLMIEAVPVALNSIMVIVTKVSADIDLSNQHDLIAQPLAELAKLRKQLLDAANLGDNGPLADIRNDLSARKTKKQNSGDTSYAFDPDVFIYSFTTLDDVCIAAERVSPIFYGDSTLYKRDGQFYLVLHKKEDKLKDDEGLLCDILSEHGQRHISTKLSKYLYEEHGEVIIAEDAVPKLLLI